MNQALWNWLHKVKGYPRCPFEWKLAAGEPVYEMLIRQGCIDFHGPHDNAPRIFDGEYEYKTELWHDGRIHAVNRDEFIDRFFTFDDARLATFNGKGFAAMISKALDFKRMPTTLPIGNVDGFYLGEVHLLADYQLYVCFSTMDFIWNFKQFQKKDFIPILYVLFPHRIGTEVVQVIEELGGQIVDIGKVFSLTQKGMLCTTPLQEIVTFKGTRKPTEHLLFSEWGQTNLPYPTRPSCSQLSIDILAATHFKITFGDSSIELAATDIDFFRQENTGSPNRLWTALLYAAHGKAQETVSPESLKTYAKQLNRNFRDFFKIKDLAFSALEARITPNFQLSSSCSRDDYRVRKEIFEGCT